MKKLLFMILCALIGSVAYGQQRNVTGIVTDQAGQFIPGVTVVVKGTTSGTITNINGEFQIQASSQDVLQFSFLGMEMQEVSASQTNLKVAMKVSSELLEDVVVVGYGTSDVKDLTAPIVTIDSEKLSQRSVQNPMTALQGQVAGMNIVSSGSPGSAPNVKIRGVSTMSGTTDPLYVVDGMFMSNLDYLNPEDIESVSILKDASSAAIYGVRAAGGVIVVTTKQGKKEQKAQVSYNGYYGFQHVGNRVERADNILYSQYQRAIGNESLVENSINMYGGFEGADGSMYPTTNSDWYDYTLETAPIQSHNLSVVGGSSKVKYSFGGSYFGQEGISGSEDLFQRFTLRSKVDAELSDFITVGSNLIVSKINNDGSAANFNSSYYVPSIVPAYDQNNYDEKLNPYGLTNTQDMGISSSMGNPLTQQTYLNGNHSSTYKILPTFYAEFDFFQNDKLKLRSAYMQEIAMNMTSNLINEYQVSENQRRIPSHLSKSMTNYYNYVFNNVLTYADTKGDHRYSAMLGMEMRENNMRKMSGNVDGVPNGDEEYNYIDLGDDTTAKIDDEGTTERGLSYFGRVSYTFKDRYLFTGTMRMDGTSKWGNSKIGYFPSLGAGWILSEESFMAGTSSFMDYFKLRASWGILGNEGVGATNGSRSVSSLDVPNSGVFGDQSQIGYEVTNNYSTLDWEELHEINFGFDSRWFNNRLNFTFDWYQRNTPNMVIDYVLPNNQGTIKDNYGAMKNTGVDLALGWADKKGDFSYSFMGTMSFMNNEVTDLEGQPYLTSDNGRRHIEGSPIDAFYGYKVIGVYQTQEEIDSRLAVKDRANTAPGDFIYADINGDNQINSDDRTVLGSHLPDMNYGMNINLGYKQWELGMSFYGTAGAEILNNKRRNINKNMQRNQDVDLLTNAWSGVGSTNEYVSLEGLTKSRNGFNDSSAEITSFSVESADYFKVQNIQLAYNLPKSLLNRMHISKWRLYVNADNPINIFKYNGFSPEIASGFDDNFYPIPSTYTFGMNITF